MKTEPTYYIDMITRYLDGEASSDDLLELSAWINSNPENQSVFNDYYQTWLQLRNDQINAFSIEEAWETVRTQTIDKPLIVSPSFSRIWFAAAILILLLIPSVFVFRYFSKPVFEKVTASSIQNQQLPDGTVVMLTPGSSLEFSHDFSGKTRNVKLIGEAYFKVTHDASKPFIVEMGAATIEVLGTSFYVNTRSTPKTIDVVLTNGSVKISYPSKPEVQSIMQPGEKATISTDRQEILKNLNTDQNYMCWVDKKLVFSNNELHEVVVDLKKVYGVDIQIKEKDLSHKRITATFDHQSLESVLKVLCSTLDVQIHQSNKTFEIVKPRK